MQYLATTNPGMEEIVLKELVRINDTVETYKCTIPGTILFSFNTDTCLEHKLLKLRSVHQIYRHFCFIEKQGDLWDKNQILKKLIEFDYSFIGDDQFFRACVKRHFSGDVDFKTVDIERALVSHIEDNYKKSCNFLDVKYSPSFPESGEVLTETLTETVGGSTSILSSGSIIPDVQIVSPISASA